MNQEIEDLMCKLAEKEKVNQAAIINNNEKHKYAKCQKKEVTTLKEKLALAEKELAIKDAEYDKQLQLQSSSGVIENLPVKHSQKVQELDSLQNTFIDLETKIDGLHSKQILKTTEVRLLGYN